MTPLSLLSGTTVRRVTVSRSHNNKFSKNYRFGDNTEDKNAILISVVIQLSDISVSLSDVRGAMGSYRDVINGVSLF